MANLFTNKISELIGLKENRLTILKNNDHFLYKKEVQKELSEIGVEVVSGSSLDIRIHFELNYKANKDQYYCYLVANHEDLLEDILNEGCCKVFQLITYFPEYHAETILSCSVYELNLLFNNKPLNTLSEAQTVTYLSQCKLHEISNKDQIKNRILSELKSLIDNPVKDWSKVIVLVSEVILTVIKEGLWEEIKAEIKNINEQFQHHLEHSFKAHIIPASFVKKPSVVSNVLPFIHFNFNPKDKVAVIVIDGMSYWQFLMLASHLHEEVEISPDIIYSWIPSITQLSRQAIFRGTIPVSNYKQDPANESKLWYTYWLGKGIMNTQIRYDYRKLKDENLTNILRLALVDDALDNKMHASADYNDLYDLTQNWIENTSIVQSINRLLSDNFTVFITTDHGNLKARSLNYLGAKEKLGTNKSGSRSLRHLEYSDIWLKDQFLANHEDWLPFLGQDDNTIYIKNDFAFSTDGSIVTHGGSHFLEVLIPFITLKKVNK
ncbi:MAG: PglZ domain-containing protein [Bacteroidales bacterium]|nr:PglZ domain-containing protein [Bacteroidales bacterium]